MRVPLLLTATAMIALLPATAQAQDRYRERPPVLVSPDLAAPWVMQLQNAPEPRAYRSETRSRREQPRLPRNHVVRVAPDPEPQPKKRVRRAYREPQVNPIQTAAAPGSMRSLTERGLAPEFLPQTVTYEGSHKPGTIVIDTQAKFLFLVEDGGKARRYGVGVGKEGFGWSGTETITNKREWPTWTPPAEMRAREKAKGRILPVTMEGGPANPLGARALYLGSTLYRIHGTNAPWTIGTNVSSGCIRMRNEDVVDLYERVKIGTKVVVM
jgi:lipoprotein-anchoring transpeptidase ErfK/SrfK